MEPRFNEPLFDEVLDITNNILGPGQSYSKMCIYNEFFDITNIIRKPKENLPRYNELRCQHMTEDKRRTDQQSANPLILIVKRQQPFSQRLITCRRHWCIVFPQKSPVLQINH